MILHIAKKEIWEEVMTKGNYEGDTLASQGFIHCSTLEQVINIANRFYKNQQDLLLLVIDDSKVRSEIKYEDGGDGNLYPHIYGSLNKDAVAKIEEFTPQEDGSFILPTF